MDKENLYKLLDNIKEENEEIEESQRILLIDGLNLFFRNFTRLNMVTSEGLHIGGLGGFLRSLGALIKKIKPTSVYIVFDGVGSSHNRKNLLPEYKSNRNNSKVLNWEVFDTIEEEDESKLSQIIRVIQYLKCLPVIIISIDKVEADDIIAYLGSVIPCKKDDKIFIVSSDKDFIQLIDQNIIVYRPIEKEFYTYQKVIEKYNIPPQNFILYKTLLGDASDRIQGVKGLGEKGILKKFPELTERELNLNDIYEICKEKLHDHIIYARILQDIERLEKTHKIMDLKNPMLDKKDKEYLLKLVSKKKLHYNPTQFLSMYKQDRLEGVIRNVDLWLKENFEVLKLK